MIIPKECKEVCFFINYIKMVIIAMKMVFLEKAPAAWTLMAVMMVFLYYMIGFLFPAGGLYFWLPVILFQGLAGFSTGLLIKRLLEQSCTDPLTGFYNRRFFYQQLQREADRFHRYGNPLSIAMVDLDDFKKVNDKFGHIAGDKVLQAVSGVFKNSLRKTDIIARWGGEEFAVILSGTGPEDAQAVAERLRKRIERTVLSEPDLSLTVSIGIASFTENMALQELVLAADRAMYRAKRSKNKVVKYADELDLSIPAK